MTKYIENSQRRVFETLKYLPIQRTVLIYRIKPTSRNMKWASRVHTSDPSSKVEVGLREKGCDRL